MPSVYAMPPGRSRAKSCSWTSQVPLAVASVLVTAGAPALASVTTENGLHCDSSWEPGGYCRGSAGDVTYNDCGMNPACDGDSSPGYSTWCITITGTKDYCNPGDDDDSDQMAPWLQAVIVISVCLCCGVSIWWSYCTEDGKKFRAQQAELAAEKHEAKMEQNRLDGMQREQDIEDQRARRERVLEEDRRGLVLQEEQENREMTNAIITQWFFRNGLTYSDPNGLDYSRISSDHVDGVRFICMLCSPITPPQAAKVLQSGYSSVQILFDADTSELQRSGVQLPVAKKVMKFIGAIRNHPPPADVQAIFQDTGGSFYDV